MGKWSYCRSDPASKRIPAQAQNAASALMNFKAFDGCQSPDSPDI
jgi:hypothetical protein